MAWRLEAPISAERSCFSLTSFHAWGSLSERGAELDVGEQFRGGVGVVVGVDRGGGFFGRKVAVVHDAEESVGGGGRAG